MYTNFLQQLYTFFVQQLFLISKYGVQKLKFSGTPRALLEKKNSMTTIEKTNKNGDYCARPPWYVNLTGDDHGNRYLLYPLTRTKKSHKLKKLIFYDLRIIKV